MTETQPDPTPLKLNRTDALVLAALLLLAVLVLSPVLFAGAGRAPGLLGADATHLYDARTQWVPYRAYAVQSLKDGVLPLWNPYILCGTPFVGSFQSALFYPPNALFLMAPLDIAARLSILLHVWLSILFTYLLARGFGCRWVGCGVAAMAYAFCAAQLLRVPAGHWGVSCAIPWLPLIWLCAELLMRRVSTLPLLIGAFAVAMQVLSGVPQYVFITGVATVVFVLLRGISREFTFKRAAAGWGLVAGMFVLGAALSAVQLVPGLEAARHGARSLPMRQDWLELFSLGPESVLTLLTPSFFGGSNGVPYWGRFLFWEMNAYAGVVVLAFVVAGIVYGRPKGIARRLAILAGLMFLLALGKHTPLMGVVAGLTPVGGMLRGSAKFILPTSAAFAIMAGLGIEALLSERETIWRKAIHTVAPVAGAVALVLLLTLSVDAMLGPLRRLMLNSGESFVNPTMIQANASAQGNVIILTCAVALVLLGFVLVLARIYGKKNLKMPTGFIAGVCLCLVALDAMHFGRLFVTADASFPTVVGFRSEAVSALLRRGGDTRAQIRSGAAMNDAMIGRTPTAEGMEPNPPARFHELFRRGQRVPVYGNGVKMGEQELPVDVAPSVYQLIDPDPIGRLTATGRFVTSPGAKADALVERIHRGTTCDVFERRDAVSRALIVHNPVMAESREDALARTLAADPKRVVVLEEDVKRAELDATMPPATREDAYFVKDMPNIIVVRAMLRRPGFLVLLDNHFPGWSAQVNDTPVPILRANYAFRAVALPAGTWEVTFEYKPDSLKWGFRTSMVAIVLSAVLVVVWALRERRRARIADRARKDD